MSRLIKFSLLALLLLGFGVVVAQDTQPQATPFPTLALAASPTPDVALLAATLPPPEVTTEPGAGPTAVPTSALGLEQTEALPILINDRADLELLATTAIGSAQRPIGWSGTIDVTDPQLPLWIRLDLETLAGAVMGPDKRPPGWFGVVPSIPIAVARDIRHDLELLADVVVGSPTVRPGGWKGDDPMYRCTRATQALFALLQHDRVTFKVDFTQPNYCDVAEVTASRYVERQIIQPPPAIATSGPADQLRYPYQVDNPFVVGFLDRKARQKIGVLPVGTGFQPVSRSYIEFSNMMLVQGDGFLVFVDYTTTQITTEQFLGLPDVGSGGGTTCSADWCGQGLN